MTTASYVQAASSVSPQDEAIKQNIPHDNGQENSRSYEGRKVRVMQGFSQAARICNWGMSAAFTIYVSEHEKYVQSPSKDVPYEQLSPFKIRDKNFGYEGDKTEESVRERMEKLKNSVHILPLAESERKSCKMITKKISIFFSNSSQKISCIYLQK